MRNNLLSSARFANIYINLQTRNQDKHLVPKAPEAPELKMSTEPKLAIRETTSTSNEMNVRHVL